MGSVILRHIKTTPEGWSTYSARWSNVGEGLPRRPQRMAPEMLIPQRETDRRFIPRGVDRNTPGGGRL